MLWHDTTKSVGLSDIHPATENLCTKSTQQDIAVSCHVYGFLLLKVENARNYVRLTAGVGETARLCWGLWRRCCARVHRVQGSEIVTFSLFSVISPWSSAGTEGQPRLFTHHLVELQFACRTTSWPSKNKRKSHTRRANAQPTSATRQLHSRTIFTGFSPSWYFQKLKAIFNSVRWGFLIIHSKPCL